MTTLADLTTWMEGYLSAFEGEELTPELQEKIIAKLGEKLLPLMLEDIKPFEPTNPFEPKTPWVTPPSPWTDPLDPWRTSPLIGDKITWDCDDSQFIAEGMSSISFDEKDTVTVCAGRICVELDNSLGLMTNDKTDNLTRFNEGEKDE